MGKKSFTTMLIAGGLVICNPLFSATFFHKFIPAPVQKSLKSVQQVRDNEGDKHFADFAGTWVGQCDNDEDKDTLVIANDDFGLTIDGLHFSTETLETHALSEQTATVFMHTILEWQQDYSALLLKVVYVLRSPALDFNMMGYEEGTLAVKDNQLSMTLTSQSPEGKEDVFCVYTKQ
ncbi:hypothetical protein GH742_07845 [Legionella sp. MW5194]|uniref:hypothetical protein n=1 Tax=Legionella sp. MW5194 TaxID=2662448 RepID=UPI00193D74AA|nr:hypothetical protein [Legionella sp. MW5194]QRN03790.1 hypothetical protein GH742_07845 [Legionella sp. MW5194]